jgi:hypothetical protein
VLIGTAGNKVELSRGSRAELDFLLATFRDALRLPPDPLRRSAYPPAPPWWSRVSRRIIPGGVVVKIRPRPPWITAAVLVVPVFLAVGAADRILFEGQGVGWAHVTTSSALEWLRIAVIFAFVEGILVWALYRFRRLSIIASVNGEVALRERSPIRPCHVIWPAADVVRFELENDPARPRRGCSLCLVLQSGATRLLSGEPEPLVKQVFDTLSVALACRPQRPPEPPPAPAPAAESARTA